MAGKKKSFIVYRHTRLDTNEVFYIGIGKNETRAFEKKSRNRYWKHIINKTPYKVEIIANVDTWEDACELEQLLISEYGRKDLNTGILVNLTDGGDGGYGMVVSKETRKKQSDAKIGKYVGENSARYGMSHTEEARLKISLAHKGKTLSKETRDKMSKFRLGQKFSDERRENMKNASTCAKKLIDTETGEIYKSISECSKLTGIKRTTLNAMLVGQSPNNSSIIYLENYEW